MYDIIVIGGGMAGMTASLYALRNDKKVLIIERESVGGQISQSPKVENYPTKKTVRGAELADEVFEQITDLGVDFELEDVLSVEKEGNEFIVTTNYNTYKSKAVILATGVKHRTLGIAKEEKLIGKGVYYCAICDGPFFAGQEVTLIGDANSAMQYALMLAGYCKQVNMFTLFDKFFGEKALEEAIKKTPNIKITQNVKAVDLIGEDSLEAIVFENTTDGSRFEHKTNAVFVAIGQIPDNKKYENLVELDDFGYIVANENCITRTPGLFVAGDCRTKEVRQVATAVADGAISATKACKYLSTLEG
ncbi:MAG: FAD-dependent oxidoreductase [Clostridia bacterium]|nr:FAD-dependent oxidoreductase [Clostridia bacterium]